MTAASSQIRQRRRPLASPTALLAFFSQRSSLALGQAAGTLGDERCPCLPADEVAKRTNVTPATTVFGAGCAPHDNNTDNCSSVLYSCESVVPLPRYCDRSYCDRSWCFVDTNQTCNLTHNPSSDFPGSGLHYSYATCGYMDSFTGTRRILSLRDRVFRVGFNSNTGGYSGSYNPEGHFAINNDWTGPTVNFVRQAALEGGFSINLTAPPSWIEEEAKNFYNSSSKFDLCVYATALGYLDFCTALYTISDRRAATATWFELESQPLHLVIFEEAGSSKWDRFSSAFTTIFDPFTLGAWLMILFMVLPVMGLLMLYHEYGVPGSVYPKSVKIVARDEERTVESKRDVPFHRHVIMSLYTSLLAFFQESYSQSVVSLGGKVHLLGISFFILTIIAVYTANLAAILTQDPSHATIDNLQDAIDAGYNFCASRKIAQIVSNINENDILDRFVVDPISEGGDGKPAFICPKCESRIRVFDFMQSPNTDRSLYCDAAIAAPEDLEVLHSQGLHCNKTLTSEILGQRNIGLPIYDGVSKELISLMLQLKNEGLFSKELEVAKPESSCPAGDASGSEGSSLTVQQLTGVWIITCSFAALALCLKAVHPYYKRWRRRRGGGGTDDEEREEYAIRRFDQWGVPAAHSMYFDTAHLSQRNVATARGSIVASVHQLDGSIVTHRTPPSKSLVIYNSGSPDGATGPEINEGSKRRHLWDLQDDVSSLGLVGAGSFTTCHEGASQSGCLESITEDEFEEQLDNYNGTEGQKAVRFTSAEQAQKETHRMSS